MIHAKSIFPFSQFEKLEDVQTWADKLCSEDSSAGLEPAQLAFIRSSLLTVNDDIHRQATWIIRETVDALTKEINQASNINDVVAAFQDVAFQGRLRSNATIAVNNIIEHKLQRYFSIEDAGSLMLYGLTGEEAKQKYGYTGTAPYAKPYQDMVDTYGILHDMLTGNGQLHLTRSLRERMINDAKIRVREYKANPARLSLLDSNVDMDQLLDVLTDFFQVYAPVKFVCTRDSLKKMATEFVERISSNKSADKERLIMTLSNPDNKSLILCAAYLCGLPIKSTTTVAERGFLTDQILKLADDYEESRDNALADALSQVM